MMENGGELMRDPDEERMLVSVRLRPLNKDEISSNDVSDWECISSDTIVCKNNAPSSEISMYPIAYTFDRVFKSDSSMRMVYEEGAKDSVISVVRGINSTVLAYGETSSGKTHTMTGITEYAVADIYHYIDKHPEREFLVKFSAMEIYNECIRDLLSSDHAPLKLLQDPQRGTIVENLTEEVLRDRDHVTELLFICEAQRQTGDILVNEESPQSHQIAKLTIQSSPREHPDWETPPTLTATASFVDLAGSEQAGTRDKQGCRVDHSLLTLGAVIRKLSKGRNEHIPYRESKLTQVLQSSLSGNARSSLLCTISPARSHVEQSRKTLQFASCVKGVTTSARVNVVMSDKSLVKRLQKDIARLENELSSRQSTINPGSFSTLLREKDTQIDRLEKEVRDLILQRDIFQSQVKELLKMLGDTASSISQVGAGNYPNLRVLKSPDVYAQDQELRYSDVDTSDGFSRSNSEYRPVKVMYLDLEQSNASPNILLGGSSLSESDLFHGWHEIDKHSNVNLEGVCREVNCPDKEYCGETTCNYSYFQESATAIRVYANSNQQSSLAKDQQHMSSFLEEDVPSTSGFIQGEEPTKIKGEEPISAGPTIQYPDNASLQQTSLPHDNQECQSLPKNTFDTETATSAGKNSNADSLTEKEITPISVDESRSDTKESVEKDVKKMKLEAVGDKGIGLTSWPVEFKRLQREILELWHACNVTLVHRTYFFMLFQGDPTDAIYLEVEVRKMKLLKGKFSRGEKIVVDGQHLTLSSSAKNLRQERRMLSEQMTKKLSEQERDVLFVEWGIDLNSKMRRMQVANLLWSKPQDISHATKSANLVAKLAGFHDPGHTPTREVFGTSLTPKYTTGICTYKRSLGSLL